MGAIYGNKRSGQLEAAVATLINSQAHFMGAVQRMGRLANIDALLVRCGQMLQYLPEAIRQKIGFKPDR